MGFLTVSKVISLKGLRNQSMIMASMPNPSKVYLALLTSLTLVAMFGLKIINYYGSSEVLEFNTIFENSLIFSAGVIIFVDGVVSELAGGLESKVEIMISMLLILLGESLKIYFSTEDYNMIMGLQKNSFYLFKSSIGMITHFPFFVAFVLYLAIQFRKLKNELHNGAPIVATVNKFIIVTLVLIFYFIGAGNPILHLPEVIAGFSGYGLFIEYFTIFLKLSFLLLCTYLFYLILENFSKKLIDRIFTVLFFISVMNALILVELGR